MLSLVKMKKEMQEQSHISRELIKMFIIKDHT